MKWTHENIHHDPSMPAGISGGDWGLAPCLHMKLGTMPDAISQNICLLYGFDIDIGMGGTTIYKAIYFGYDAMCSCADVFSVQDCVRLQSGILECLDE